MKGKLLREYYRGNRVVRMKFYSDTKEYKCTLLVDKKLIKEGNYCTYNKADALAKAQELIMERGM